MFGRIRAVTKTDHVGDRRAGAARLRRVNVRDRQPLHLAMFVDDVHRAPVGNLRYGELSDGSQRFLVIERAAKRRARFGKKRRLAVRALCLLAAPALRLEKLRARNRGRREVAERARRLDLDLVELVRRPVIEDQRTGAVTANRQRHRHHRFDPFLAERPRAILEQRRVGDRGDNQRLGERDGAHVLPAERLDEHAAERFRNAVGGANAPLLHPRIEQPHGIPVGPKQRAREDDKRRQDVVHFRRTEKRPGCRHQRHKTLPQIGLLSLCCGEAPPPPCAAP